MERILIVEDEVKLADAIAEGLRQSGFEAAVAWSGEQAMKHLATNQADVILLDLMLPRLSGLEIVRELRRGGTKTPVLILTSRGDVDDRVRGLDAGADDYLVKPFAFPELLARLRALKRRTVMDAPVLLQVADLTMDLKAHVTTRAGSVLDLTAREFELLEYLMANRGTLVSREMIVRDVWKAPMRYSTLDNVIDVHIARIRRKVDDPFPAKLLHTIRGVGFVLRQAQED
ncbi:MAG TPA: response regulator transcription factor [Terracidiphilus sp.]|jgi:DNA-binding response OmpR family regulator